MSATQLLVNIDSAFNKLSENYSNKTTQVKKKNIYININNIIIIYVYIDICMYNIIIVLWEWILFTNKLKNFIERISILKFLSRQIFLEVGKEKAGTICQYSRLSSSFSVCGHLLKGQQSSESDSPSDAVTLMRKALHLSERTVVSGRTYC